MLSTCRHVLFFSILSFITALIELNRMVFRFMFHFLFNHAAAHRISDMFQFHDLVLYLIISCFLKVTQTMWLNFNVKSVSEL